MTGQYQEFIRIVHAYYARHTPAPSSQRSENNDDARRGYAWRSNVHAGRETALTMPLHARKVDMYILDIML